MHPQEFLSMVPERSEFEFVGWWNDWDLADPLPTANQINRPITILRKPGPGGSRVRPG
jgi:hypothetical protein